MKPRLSMVAAALPFVFTPPQLQAQSASSLNPVIVSATRVEQKLSDVIPSATVITREEIDRAQAPTLVDLLQGQPGIEIGRNGGPGSMSSIFMRGQNSSSLAVFVDGVRMQTDLFGGLKMVDIPPNQIERVEILRGNMGALYGEAATGGVIHIFTRAGGGVSGPSGSLTYGSKNTSDLALGYKLDSDDLRLGVSGQRFHSSGFSAMDPTQNANVNPGNDPFTRESLFVNAEKKLGRDTSVGLMANSIQGKVDYDNGYGTPTQTNRSKTDTSDVTLFGKFQPTQDWSSRLSATQSRFRSHELRNGSPNGDTAGDQTSAQWNNVYRVGPGQTAFGLDSTQANYAASGEKYDRQSLGYYLGYSGRSGALDYQANVRHDRIDAKSSSQTLEKSASTWLLGAGYALTERLRLTGLASTSFRAPNTGELFGVSSWGVVGNPNLKPEEHKGHEFGLGYQTGLGLLKLTRFTTKTTNAIAYYDNGNWTGTYKNIGLVENEGYELDFHGTAKGWTYKLSAVTQDPRDASTGARLARRARDYGSIDLSKSFFGIDWGTKVIASSNRTEDYDPTLGSYNVVHLYASKKLTPEWTGRVKVENAFNEKYQLAYGYNTPPRGVFFTLQYQPK